MGEEGALQAMGRKRGMAQTSVVEGNTPVVDDGTRLQHQTPVGARACMSTCVLAAVEEGTPVRRLVQVGVHAEKAETELDTALSSAREQTRAGRTRLSSLRTRRKHRTLCHGRDLGALWSALKSF
jgi:hypothetical protein